MHKLHVLVLDDNVTHGESLASALRRVYGYQVTVVRSVEDAREAWEDERQMVLVLDVLIGSDKFGAIAFAQEVKKSLAGRDTRIVFLTAYRGEVERRIREVECAVVDKPSRVEEVVRAIEAGRAR